MKIENSFNKAKATKKMQEAMKDILAGNDEDYSFVFLAKKNTENTANTICQGSANELAPMIQNLNQNFAKNLAHVITMDLLSGDPMKKARAMEQMKFLKKTIEENQSWN